MRFAANLHSRMLRWRVFLVGGLRVFGGLENLQLFTVTVNQSQFDLVQPLGLGEGGDPPVPPHRLQQCEITAGAMEGNAQRG